MDVVKKNRLLKGAIFDVYASQFSDGFNAQVIQSSDAVCIAATRDGINYFLVEQFRYGINQSLLEFPAGKIDLDEAPEDAARRELREEIGYEAKTLVPLGKVYSSPAMVSEALYLYYASDLEYVGQDLDEDEVLSIKEVAFEALEENIQNDAKSMSLLYLLDKHRKAQK